MKTAVLITRILLGLIFVVFGLNGFLLLLLHQCGERSFSSERRFLRWNESQLFQLCASERTTYLQRARELPDADAEQHRA